MDRELPPSVADQHLPPLTATDAEIDAALEVANLPTLLIVLAQLTGDERWLAEPFRPTRSVALDDNNSGGLPEPVQAEVRAAARELVIALRGGNGTVPPPPAPDEVIRRLSISLGEAVPVEYGETFSEEAGFRQRAAVGWTAARPAAAEHASIVVIGAG